MVDSKNQFKSGWLLAVYFLLVVLPWAFAGIYHQHLTAAIGAYTFVLLGALFAALQAAYYFGPEEILRTGRSHLKFRRSCRLAFQFADPG